MSGRCISITGRSGHAMVLSLIIDDNGPPLYPIRIRHVSKVFVLISPLNFKLSKVNRS